MNSYRDILQQGIKILEESRIEDANNDAWLLLEYVTGMNRVKYYMDSTKIMSQDMCEEYIQLIRKRSSHIPLQHLTGTQEFMGYGFMVNEHVLVPRQDTEILVECVIDYVKKNYKVPIQLLDMCTGSGCIAISLSKLCDVERTVAVDISEDALKVAKANGKNLDVSEVTFLKSNLFENVEGKFDVIVSNPPYIPSEDILELTPEVKSREPMLALDGDVDGLKFYRKITDESVLFIKNNGLLAYEIGHQQASDVTKIMEQAGYTRIVVYKDLAGLDRVVLGTYNPEKVRD